MDRYYRILGIPDNSTKEVIKKAYHEKMKALHPDKVHGTSLEDTATFFAAEINEAYNTLMSHIKEKNTSASQTSFINEEIYIEGNGLLYYTLSNNINIILGDIINRTNHKVPDGIDEIPWSLNLNLSENVKHSMRKHNMNYSMTVFMSGYLQIIVINRKIGNDWYITVYELDTEYKQKQSATQNFNTQNNLDYSDNNISNGKIFISIAFIVIIIIIQNVSNSQTLGNKKFTQTNSSAQLFAAVSSCDWLNVRNSPSSVNNNNIIEAISKNTRVEILERNNSNWVKIKYNNGKTGYVYGNYLKLY